MNTENIALLPILFAIAAAGVLFLPERIWAKAKIGSGIGLIIAYAFISKEVMQAPAQYPQRLLEAIAAIKPEDQITNYIAIGYLVLVVLFTLGGAIATLLTLGQPPRAKASPTGNPS